MTESSSSTPKHVAVIMDGNGRWATQKGMPRGFGHQQGARRVREIVEEAARSGVEVLTLFAFSDENWSRPSGEVDALFELLTIYLESEIDHLDKEDVKLTSIGQYHRLPRDCQRLLEAGQRRTKNNGRMQLVLALSYGARSDIVAACKKIARLAAAGEVSWQDVDQGVISANLSTWDLPAPDLLIRTSGEQRISNFLLWEIAYTELYFSSVHWPDFSPHDFQKALFNYSNRQRRFGGVVDSGQPKVGDDLC